MKSHNSKLPSLSNAHPSQIQSKQVFGRDFGSDKDLPSACFPANHSIFQPTRSRSGTNFSKIMFVNDALRPSKFSEGLSSQQDIHTHRQMNQASFNGKKRDKIEIKNNYKQKKFFSQINLCKNSQLYKNCRDPILSERAIQVQSMEPFWNVPGVQPLSNHDIPVESERLLKKRNWLELPPDLRREIHSMENPLRFSKNQNVQAQRMASNIFKKVNIKNDLVHSKNNFYGNVKFYNQFEKNKGISDSLFLKNLVPENRQYHSPNREFRNTFFKRNSYNVIPPRVQMPPIMPVFPVITPSFRLPPKFSYNVHNQKQHAEQVSNEPNLHFRLQKCRLCKLNMIRSHHKKILNFAEENNLQANKQNPEDTKAISKKEGDDTITQISDSEIQKAKETPSVFKTFAKIYKLLIKLVCDDEILEEDLNMPDEHKQLVIEFMRKKKLVRNLDLPDFTCQRLTYLRDNENTRRTEERLKFIFKKCIRYIQMRFKKKKKYSDAGTTCNNDYSESVRFDYVFYGHYYSHIAKQIGQPLEKFFHFRNWKNRTSEHIPKSITKVYVNYLKMNPTFMNLFISYMNDRLIKDIVLNNVKKIFRLVREWENLAKKFEKGKALPVILKKFKSKGLKLPWGLIEVRSAIRDTLKYIIKD